MDDRAKDIVLQFYQAFDDRQIDRALNLLPPTFVAHLAGMPQPLDNPNSSNLSHHARCRIKIRVVSRRSQ